jgi:hypothetical protein
MPEETDIRKMKGTFRCNVIVICSRQLNHLKVERWKLNYTLMHKRRRTLRILLTVRRRIDNQCHLPSFHADKLIK